MALWLDDLAGVLSAPGNAKLVNKMQGHMRLASRKPWPSAVLMCFTGHVLREFRKFRIGQEG